jgi:hypothetical protein
VVVVGHTMSTGAFCKTVVVFRDKKIETKRQRWFSTCNRAACPGQPARPAQPVKPVQPSVSPNFSQNSTLASQMPSTLGISEIYKCGTTCISGPLYYLGLTCQLHSHNKRSGLTIVCLNRSKGANSCTGQASRKKSC